MRKQVCHLSLEFPQGTNKNKSHTDQAVFSAPQGWIIKSYILKQIRGLGPTSHNVTWVPANSNFVSSSELSTSYNQAIDVAADLGYKGEKLAELNANLNAAYSEYVQYSNQIAASHQTLIHKATIRGAGAFNGRTQYEAYLLAEIEEMPTALQNVGNLMAQFQSIIDDFTGNNPVDISTGNDDQQIAFEKLPDIIQTGDDLFLINKFEQLVRIYWNGRWTMDTVAAETPLERASLCYSKAHNALFAITNDNSLLVTRKINGQWETGILPTWGSRIIPATLEVHEHQFGVMGLNERGHLVTTWLDSNGTMLPGGQKLSFAVINETRNLI